MARKRSRYIEWFYGAESSGDEDLIFQRTYSHGQGAGALATFDRNSPAWTKNPDGSYTQVNDDIEQVEADGILLEPVKTNLLDYSNPTSTGDFDVTSGEAFTFDVGVDPDDYFGLTGAVISTPNDPATTSLMYQRATVTNLSTVYAYAYVKVGSGEVPSSGTAGGSKFGFVVDSITITSGLQYEAIGNGWYKIWASRASDGTLNNYGITKYSGNDAGIVQFFGIQAYEDEFQGSVIISDGAPTQRLADTLSYPLTTLSDTQGSVEIVLKMTSDYDFLTGVGSQSILSVTTSTAASLLYFGTTNGQIYSYDGTAASLVATNWSDGDLVRIRLRWNTTGNVRALSTLVNGVTLLSDTDSNYDGSWAADGTLRVMSGDRPAYVQSISIWDVDKGNSWLIET